MLTGAMGGAAAGSLGFGGMGAAIGGAGSLVAGAADIYLSDKKYQENRSYATDIHELQLGNIQAMPRTLSKTTAFNVDNRYFPVLTIYGCTEEEKKNVGDYILNRSMTVGVIGVPMDYIGNNWYYEGQMARGFIKGNIVKIDTIHDTHFVDALNDEFQKGVYLR